MGSMETCELGYLERCEGWQVASCFFPSKAGGRPSWLSLAGVPGHESLRCPKCYRVMIFLCQLYAPIPQDERNFHRTLFVFVCRNGECCATNDNGGVLVLRCSLERANEFYPYDPPEEDLPPGGDYTLEKALGLCHLCGCSADKKCGKCKDVRYCCRDHQVWDWKERHRLECGRESTKRSSLLYPEYEIITEEEEDLGDGLEVEQEAELEKFKKLQEEGKTGTLPEVTEADLDLHALPETDKVFAKFKKIVDNYPDQVVRYQRGGEPLWIAKEPIPTDIPVCKYCNGPRQFECQIMPQMLTLLKEKVIDWGVLCIYTCAANCTEGPAYKEEFIYKQDV